jgi:hypothetical protein
MLLPLVRNLDAPPEVPMSALSRLWETVPSGQEIGSGRWRVPNTLEKCEFASTSLSEIPDLLDRDFIVFSPVAHNATGNNLWLWGLNGNSGTADNNISVRYRTLAATLHLRWAVTGTDRGAIDAYAGTIRTGPVTLIFSGLRDDGTGDKYPFIGHIAEDNTVSIAFGVTPITGSYVWDSMRGRAGRKFMIGGFDHGVAGVRATQGLWSHNTFCRCRSGESIDDVLGDITASAGQDTIKKLLLNADLIRDYADVAGVANKFDALWSFGNLKDSSNNLKAFNAAIAAGDKLVCPWTDAELVITEVGSDVFVGEQNGPVGAGVQAVGPYTNSEFEQSSVFVQHSSFPPYFPVPDDPSRLLSSNINLEGSNKSAAGSLAVRNAATGALDRHPIPLHVQVRAIDQAGAPSDTFTTYTRKNVTDENHRGCEIVLLDTSIVVANHVHSDIIVDYPAAGNRKFDELAVWRITEDGPVALTPDFSDFTDPWGTPGLEYDTNVTAYVRYTVGYVQAARINDLAVMLMRNGGSANGDASILFVDDDGNQEHLWIAQDEGQVLDVPKMGMGQPSRVINLPGNKALLLWNARAYIYETEPIRHGKRYPNPIGMILTDLSSLASAASNANAYSARTGLALTGAGGNPEAGSSCDITFADIANFGLYDENDDSGSIKAVPDSVFMRDAVAIDGGYVAIIYQIEGGDGYEDSGDAVVSDHFIRVFKLVGNALVKQHDISINTEIQSIIGSGAQYTDKRDYCFATRAGKRAALVTFSYYAGADPVEDFPDIGPGNQPKGVMSLGLWGEKVRAVSISDLLDENATVTALDDPVYDVAVDGGVTCRPFPMVNEHPWGASACVQVLRDIQINQWSSGDPVVGGADRAQSNILIVDATAQLPDEPTGWLPTTAIGTGYGRGPRFRGPNPYYPRG